MSSPVGVTTPCAPCRRPCCIINRVPCLHWSVLVWGSSNALVFSSERHVNVLMLCMNHAQSKLDSTVGFNHKGLSVARSFSSLCVCFAGGTRESSPVVFQRLRRRRVRCGRRGVRGCGAACSPPSYALASPPGTTRRHPRGPEPEPPRTRCRRRS